MKKLIESIKYWGQLLLLPIYCFSFFIPRDKNIWLFGSTFGRRFADNPRYLYLYVNQYESKNIRPIWISHNKKIINLLIANGYEAYYFLSLKGIWYCLRGKVYLFDNYSKDINFWLSNGAVKINLWHGIPLKKIQADNIFDRVRHPKTKKDKFKYFLRRLSDEKPSHYVLTTSDFLIPIFSSAFKTRNVLVSGYPRNDVLISNKVKNVLTNEEDNHLKQIKTLLKSPKNKSNGLKLILYMPTFRQSETKFFNVISLQDLQSFLYENNFLFCIKLHPKSKLIDKFNHIENKLIYMIDSDADPYTFLNMADILVTDYSSIYFDFLLINKPIIFFNYDFEEYLKNSRELYFNYQQVTPGEKVSTFNELKNALLRASESKDEYQKTFETIQNKVSQMIFKNKKPTLSSPKLVNQIKRVCKISK